MTDAIIAIVMFVLAWGLGEIVEAQRWEQKKKEMYGDE